MITGIILCLLLGTIRAEAKKQDREFFRLKASEGLIQLRGHTERITAEGKATLLIKEESADFLMMQKQIARIAKKELERQEEEARRKAAEEERKRQLEANRRPNYPGGGHLTRSNGVYYFGNQRETYYNLDMSWIVSFAHQNGISGEYWIRSDGCKMLGDYIILACNRTVHPYGSIVQTSLGLGISLDTGGFAYTYPYGVDIAVNW